MKQTLRIIILCYSFILFEGLLFSMLADTGKADKEVLVLNSINFNLPWSKHFYWCVHDELQQTGNHRIYFHCIQQSGNRQ